jgi:hypothetical protein
VSGGYVQAERQTLERGKFLGTIQQEREVDPIDGVVRFEHPFGELWYSRDSRVLQDTGSKLLIHRIFRANEKKSDNLFSPSLMITEFKANLIFRLMFYSASREPEISCISRYDEGRKPENHEFEPEGERVHQEKVSDLERLVY